MFNDCIAVWWPSTVSQFCLVFWAETFFSICFAIFTQFYLTLFFFEIKWLWFRKRLSFTTYHIKCNAKCKLNLQPQINSNLVIVYVSVLVFRFCVSSWYCYLNSHLTNVILIPPLISLNISSNSISFYTDGTFCADTWWRLAMASRNIVLTAKTLIMLQVFLTQIFNRNNV